MRNKTKQRLRRHTGVFESLNVRLCSSILLFFWSLSAVTLSAQSSQWVRYGQSGRLIYQLDSRGDRVMDYSSAGYKGGQALPDIDAVIEPGRFVSISPGEGDDRQRIQDAIDLVSGRSLNSNGFRGVVDFSPGEYQIDNTLNIAASGVVLRGTGSGGIDSNPGADATVIRSTSTSRIVMINVETPGINSINLTASGPAIAITDKVVPAGATSLNVANPGSFGVGDEVVVQRSPTQAWIDSLNTAANWDISDPRFRQIQEREIVRIEGNRIFLDAPIAHSIGTFGTNGVVYRHRDRRIQNVGIEGIRGVADFDGTPTDENHADDFVGFKEVRDAWARDLTGQHLVNSTVDVVGIARSITVTDSQSIEPVSQITGSRRYSFGTNGGQFVLFQRLISYDGRHNFVFNSTFNGFNRGPNVVFNSLAIDSLSNSGAHQNYSTGVLLDNVTDTNSIQAKDRGTNANHGWEGSNYVVWNSWAGSYSVHNPPGSRNYLIGSTGPVNNIGGVGTYDSLGQPVRFNDPDNPVDSLFVAQRLELERFPEIESREYWVGDFDSLENDGASDLVYVDPDWLTAIESLSSSFHSGQPTAGFDDDSFGRKVPFTLEYDLASDEQVVSAVLSIGMKRRGGASSDDDSLWLDTTASPLGFTTEGWGPLYEGNLQVLTLELVGDVSYLQDGRLNGVLSNNRAIDWVHLMVDVAPRLAGDFDGDRNFGCDDIDILRNEIIAATNDLAFDTNGDGIVAESDIATWLSLAGASEIGAAFLMGDTDFSGSVDSTDLGVLLNNFGDTNGLGWCSGNLNADTFVDSTDLGRLLNNFGGVAASAILVPESASPSMLLIGLLVAALHGTRRHR